jgi:hypothetical protein
MTSIRIIVLPYGTRSGKVGGMMNNLVSAGSTLEPARPVLGNRGDQAAARRNPWLSWRPKRSARFQVLSVAELSECTCPEICHRDHGND